MENADTRERPEDPIQGIFVKVQRRRQFLCSFRTRFQLIGYTEFRSGRDGRSVPLGKNHFDYGDIVCDRRCWLHSGGVYTLLGDKRKCTRFQKTKILDELHRDNPHSTKTKCEGNRSKASDSERLSSDIPFYTGTHCGFTSETREIPVGLVTFAFSVI